VSEPTTVVTWEVQSNYRPEDGWISLPGHRAYRSLAHAKDMADAWCRFYAKTGHAAAGALVRVVRVTTTRLDEVEWVEGSDG
jgi:hypothetical protein